jgi:hypothetical protein
LRVGAGYVSRPPTRRHMIAPEERLRVVIETDFSGITKALGRMVAVAAAPSVVGSPPFDRKSMSGAKSARQAVRKHLRTRPLSRRSCTGSSESPDPISIGCSNIAGV